MKLIYIAGPYTKPDPVLNIRNAVEVADYLLGLGYTPIVPHLTHLWHTISPKSWDTWIEYDLRLVARCDALLRIPGESPGADIEVEHAKAIGVPVFYNVNEILES